MSITVHEAAHAVVAMAVGRRVEYIERDPGHVFPGERAGFASVDIGEGIDRERLMIALAGYMAELGPPDWPPDYEQAKVEPLEALDTIIEVLALDREDYEELCAETRRLLDDPSVRRFIAALARVLDQIPRVYEPEILAIAEAVGFPIPELVGVTDGT